MSADSRSSSHRGSDRGESASSCASHATDETHSSASSRSSSSSSSSSRQNSEHSSGSGSGSGGSHSGSESWSSSTSSASSVHSSSASPPADADEAPRKMPRLEEAAKSIFPRPVAAALPTAGPGTGGASIFPAPPTPPYTPSARPPPRYGPAFPPPLAARPSAPPLPTLSASAKDLAEVDVRAGLRLGIYRAATRLSKEQVMDEVESVRMTSAVERVLLETAQQLAAPGVPLEEREYAWATIFFADAEAAELCAARMCQPGRRSKWSRLCIQRLPVVSYVTAPLRQVEEQQLRVHVYQLESAAGGDEQAALATSTVSDTVLARSAHGWCVLSTGGLFPTAGLANYLRHRRSGDFTAVAVCADFKADAEAASCSAGGQCHALHLRSSEQWKLLLPVVVSRKASAGSSTGGLKTPPSPSLHTIAAESVAETAWEGARHADCLVVRPLPSDVDEAAFVYMFRGCKGFQQAQTVRMVDQSRYGVVRFADAAAALLAQQQASVSGGLAIHFFGEPVSNGAVSSVGTPQSTPPLETLAQAASKLSAAAATGEGATETVKVPTSDGSAPVVPSASAAGAGGADLPFPPLPDGWEYGVSRRTMQYFFVQSGKKATTWKHPVTQEQYKARR